MSKSNIVCAGIDTSKRKLEVALHKKADRVEVDNTQHGHAELLGWLRQHRVKRVGIEASGGHERAIVERLREAGLEVIVLQPAQVRAYAKFRLRRAKNDRLDAALIAASAAQVQTVHAAPDARLLPLAEHLTFIEQLTDNIARHKTCLETCRDARIRDLWKQEIARLKAQLGSELRRLTKAVREQRDLSLRLDLIESVEGIGRKTALAILIRMPEIGRLSREEAAALAGLAPYDDDSGEHKGQRKIAGGRERLRNSLYNAAFSAAFHWNPLLIALYARLSAKGKPHKLALIACARKLLIYANTVVQRGTPWIKSANAT